MELVELTTIAIGDGPPKTVIPLVVKAEGWRVSHTRLYFEH